MADPEHVELVRSGVAAVREWRDSESGEILDLHGADLSGADLQMMELWGADLGRANLTGSLLHYADLSGSNLVGADLRGANLTWAHLAGADLRDSVMGITILGEVNLYRAKHLETVRHFGPSTIDDATIERSGMLPDTFLSGCGMPDHLIEYFRSVFTNPIQVYSCFISYSARDDVFANRLHNSLELGGVRCWLAEEDLKIGDRLRPTINSAIMLHDKLLLVLSESSLRSSWVESEVEAAFEKERRDPDRTVLFPVRLDDAVMNTDVAWAAEIRRTRHIGDFRNWADEDGYARSLARLMRDLRPK